MRLGSGITSPKTLSTFETLEERCKQTHGDKYNYMKFIYTKSIDKGVITCPVHGDFEQSMANHLAGNGCPSCSIEAQFYTLDDFVTKAKRVHRGLFDYTQFKYIDSVTPSIIVCAEHDEFLQAPANHLRGNGCPKCAEERKRKKYFKQPTILYYVKLEKEGFNTVYKIGITTQGIQRRFVTETKQGLNVTIIDYHTYDNGRDAYYKEQYILKFCEDALYEGPSILIKGGNTELFKEDISDRITIK